MEQVRKWWLVESLHREVEYFLLTCVLAVLSGRNAVFLIPT